MNSYSANPDFDLMVDDRAMSIDEWMRHAPTVIPVDHRGQFMPSVKHIFAAHDKSTRVSEARQQLMEQTMVSYTDLCDCPLAVTLSKPTVLVKAYYDYRRYAVSIKTKDAPPFLQERDVLIAGKVVVVIPIDLVRQQIVLIRRFRLPAHIANGLAIWSSLSRDGSSQMKLLLMLHDGNVEKKSVLHRKKLSSCSVCLRLDLQTRKSRFFSVP